MRDVDILVRERDLEAAADQLVAQGYVPEGGLDAGGIRDRRRTGHAWQFSLGTEQSCDLHWRPLVRCYSPEITRRFWENTEVVMVQERIIRVLAPAEQIFH